MKTKNHSVRLLALAGVLTLLLLAAAPGRAHAAFLFTLTQTGGNVVVTGSGTLNTTALTTRGIGGTGDFIDPSFALLNVGSVNVGFRTVYSGISGPGRFGVGSGTTPTSTTGDGLALDGTDGQFTLTSGYVSGAPLADSATFANATFASLGFTPGTYTYTWGTGANADSLTVTGVPEPSARALLGLGVAALGLTLRQRRARLA